MDSRASVDVLRGWITRVERDAEEAATGHNALYGQVTKQSCEPWKEKDEFSRLLTGAMYPLNISSAASSLEEARGLLRAWARSQEEADEASVLQKAAPLVLDPSQNRQVARSPPRKNWTKIGASPAEVRLARHASKDREMACEPKRDMMPPTYNLVANSRPFPAPNTVPTTEHKRVTKPSVAWVLPAKDTCKHLFLYDSPTCTATKPATRDKDTSPSVPRHTETQHSPANTRREKIYARQDDAPLAECRISSPCSDIEPRQSTERPQPESAPTMQHRAEADELRRRRRSINLRIDALQQAWATRRMRLIVRVWRSSACCSSQQWHVAVAQARFMCFRRTAGHVLKVWVQYAAESANLKRDFFTARDRRKISSAMHTWKSRVLHVAKLTMTAELSLRWRRLACVWSGWMRAIRLLKSEREAAEISRELEAARRKERSADRWFKRRVKSVIFVGWLEATTMLREERTIREQHEERRRKVLVLEARIAVANEHSNDNIRKNRSTPAASQTARCTTEGLAQDHRSTDFMQHSLQHHAMKRTGPVAASVKVQPACADRRYDQNFGKLDARANERRARRKALALQTQERVKQQRAVARAANERKEEDDANSLRAYQVARAEAEAAAEASRALVRHQAFVARLHFERACLRWRGTVPWRQYVVATRLLQCKAKRWHADGLMQRTWSAWLDWQTQCRRRVLEARQQAVLAAVRAVERFRCRMPLARWVSSVQDVAILGAAVTTKHRLLLALRKLAVWRRCARREAALGAERWQRAVEFARRATERRIMRVWLRKLHVWRQGDYLEQRCDKKWGLVRGWIDGRSPTAPKPNLITA